MAGDRDWTREASGDSTSVGLGGCAWPSVAHEVACTVRILVAIPLAVPKIGAGVRSVLQHTQGGEIRSLLRAADTSDSLSIVAALNASFRVACGCVQLLALGAAVLAQRSVRMARACDVHVLMVVAVVRGVTFTVKD